MVVDYEDDDDDDGDDGRSQYQITFFPNLDRNPKKNSVLAFTLGENSFASLVAMTTSCNKQLVVQIPVVYNTLDGWGKNLEFWFSICSHTAHSKLSR